MNKVRAILMGLVALVVSAMLLTGCGSDNHSNNAYADDGFDDASSQSCVAEMSQADINEAQNRLNQARANGLDDPSVGVQQVCTINPQTGDIHYYNRQDNRLQNYLLYAALTGRATSFGSMYMLSGGDPFDAILMDHFIGVNRYGSPFYPYSAYDGGYRRAPAQINNITVNNVYYGNTKESYSDSLTKAPAGYKPAAVTLPKSSEVTGEGPLSGPGGKPVSKVAPIPGKNGQADSASKPVKPVAKNATVKPPAKAVAPGANVPNPNKGNSPSSPSTPAQPPASQAPRSQTPKPPSTQTPKAPTRSSSSSTRSSGRR